MPERYKKSVHFMVIIAVIAVIAIFIATYFVFSVKDNHSQGNAEETVTDSLVVDDGVDIEKENEIEEDFTEIPVYTSFTVDKKSPNIYLGNPEMNNVYFRYKVYLKPDDGNEIEESSILFDDESVIKPGRAFEVNLYELLETGEYKVIVDISTFSMEDETQCNGATQEVKITVK